MALEYAGIIPKNRPQFAPQPLLAANSGWQTPFLSLSFDGEEKYAERELGRAKRRENEQEDLPVVIIPRDSVCAVKVSLTPSTV